MPVLVLAGGHGKVDPPTVVTDHLLPLIPTASLTVLEGTGRLSPLEVPDQVAGHVGAFVAPRAQPDCPRPAAGPAVSRSRKAFDNPFVTTQTDGPAAANRRTV
ncbi:MULTISPECIES: alpha/beta fold hydrolase [Streptomyces]|uniref:alpha/beta fold hydrolase n=1 Tax=Streptomyces TaxID=1883 RepID=UPI000B044765|nr:hypothetical protein [Streptomyces durhamensis]